MEFLFAVIVVATIVGGICAALGKGRVAATCAGVVPWLASLMFLFYGDH